MKLPKREFSNFRLQSTSSKGLYFGAYTSKSTKAKKGYDFFISNTDDVKDWCECMGFVHGKVCYHLKEAKKRFGV